MRIDKVNELMKREISNMILMGEIKDPRLSFVTITQVEVSKDLRHARVSFSVLTNNPKEIKSVQDGLDSARGHVRKLVGQRIRIRFTPEVYFVHDRSLEYSDLVDRTLTEIKKQESRDE